MKKIYALALGLATVVCAGAQNDAKSLYEAGKKAEDVFNKNIDMALVTQQMDPAQAYSLVEAYALYMQALPLDSLPNEKGKVDPKVSKKIVKSLVKHVKEANFERVALFLYNSGKQYPEAYQAFRLAAELPHNPLVGEEGKFFNDTICAGNYYNAGQCAYANGKYAEAADAFKHARLLNPTKVDYFVYEIAGYQNADFGENQAAKDDAIYAAAEEGYKHHGASNTFIFNNYVNKYFSNDDVVKADAILREASAADPTNANIELLFGILRNKEQKFDEAADHFRKAGELGNVYGTLLDAGKQLNLLGKNALNAIDYNAANVAELKSAVKKDYFEKALEIANKAKACTDADTQVDSLIEDINYSLENYFN